MAGFTLRAGRHYHAMPPFSFLPWIGQQKTERYVTFDESCAYDSADYNGLDVNKLFGLSFGLRGVHWNSARFGWRWSKSAQCIELLAYVYKEGVRNHDEQLRYPVVAQVKPGQRVYCKIIAEYDEEFEGPHYLFEVDADNQPWRMLVVPRPKSLPSYGLTHGLYFGGALSAPHEMKVQIDRV